MKLFQFTGDGEIVIVEKSKESEGVKVKISKALLSPYDMHLFSGKVKANYPVTPCHMATAIVSEDNEELKQGQKVILNPFYKEDEDAQDHLIYGKDIDGFLCDFISLPHENIIFMQDIKEDDGIFLCYIAQAIAILDSLKPQKGDYVAVVGASPIMNILAQLVLYYQGIPIVIGNNNNLLNKARDNGVYYTINATAESPFQRVLAITGGRLAECSVYMASENISSNYMLDLLQEGGRAVVMGVKEGAGRSEVDISAVYKKGLTLSGITNYAGKIDGAVNILMQGILKLDNLCDLVISIEELDKVKEMLTQWSADSGFYSCPIIKIT